MQREAANSHIIATILIVVITIILSALILLLFKIPVLKWEISTIPAIITITNIIHVDDYTGKMNYDSRMILIHTCKISYKNSDLKAYVFRNGKPLSCVIQTLNANEFIHTVHLGVQWIGFAGCSGTTWDPGEMAAIDFTDGTFHPGDLVQIDFIDKRTNTIISRHSFRAA